MSQNTLLLSSVLLAQGMNAETMVLLVLIGVVLVVMLVGGYFVASYFRLWIQSFLTNAGISILDLMGMTYLKKRSYRKEISRASKNQSFAHQTPMQN